MCYCWLVVLLSHNSFNFMQETFVPSLFAPLSRYPGRLSPPREDYHLSLATLENCHPLIAPTITLGDYQPRNKVTCRPFLEYFFPYPFPHNYSGAVVCFHSKGYGLGTLIARNFTKKH